MAAFAGIPLEVEMEARAGGHKLNLPTLRLVNLYRCRQDGFEFLIHFEGVRGTGRRC